MTALAFTTIGFVALLIAGFGLTSLLTDTEVIAVPNLGFLPGALGVAVATVAFAAITGLAVRLARPQYTAVIAITASVFIGYLAGLWVGALLTGAGLAPATAAMGSFATSVFALVLLGAAVVCAWAAIALVRTRAGRPRWPWEDGPAEP
jgi:hypothetical protein